MRPLLNKQKLYAAQDADILIELYKEIKRRAQMRGHDFEELVKEALNVKEQQEKKKKNKRNVEETPWSEIVEVFRKKTLFIQH